MFSRDRTDGRSSEIVGLLDIGTSKVACIIAALDPPERPGEGRRARVLGIGHLRSRGLKAGVITDLAEAEATVRAAIAQAERMAHRTLEEVFVSVSCGRLQSSNFSASVDITGGVVRDDDIDRLMTGGHAFAEREGRTLIHLNRLAFRVDGAAGSHDPRGMAACPPVGRSAYRCRRRGAGAQPDAGGRALLSQRARADRHPLRQRPGRDQRGGAPPRRHLHRHRRRHGDGRRLRGRTFHPRRDDSRRRASLTLDIAQALQTPLAEAERIKTLYGTMVVAQSDEYETFSFALAGEEDGMRGQATKAQLAGIIRPRVAGILGLVRERLDKAGVAAFAGERVVLTGGASGLVGLGEFAANTLGRPARVSMPQASRDCRRTSVVRRFRPSRGCSRLPPREAEKSRECEIARRSVGDTSSASESG